ncbi:MAG: hypothetical protein CL609_15425 [Anaerolineaceae bacterium]|nr:hypothetical protein [Anaerolineaceae bacterium]
MNQDCNCSVTKVTDQLHEAGFSVVRSFDLLSARGNLRNCICQKVILLVYEQEGPPVTLIFDGNAISTSIFLENFQSHSTRSRVTNLLSQLSPVDQTLDNNQLNGSDEKSNPLMPPCE